MKRILFACLSAISALAFCAEEISAEGSGYDKITQYSSEEAKDLEVPEDCEIEFQKYKGDDENVNLPQAFGKFTIAVVAGGAFEENDAVKSVSVPPSVKKICARAFCKCKNLERIEIPPSVVEIEDDAVFECPKAAIFARPDSAAAKWAQEKGVPFQELK